MCAKSTLSKDFCTSAVQQQKSLQSAKNHMYTRPNDVPISRTHLSTSQKSALTQSCVPMHTTSVCSNTAWSFSFQMRSF